MGKLWCVYCECIVGNRIWIVVILSRGWGSGFVPSSSPYHRRRLTTIGVVYPPSSSLPAPHPPLSLGQRHLSAIVVSLPSSSPYHRRLPAIAASPPPLCPWTGVCLQSPARHFANCRLERSLPPPSFRPISSVMPRNLIRQTRTHFTLTLPRGAPTWLPESRGSPR